MKCLTDEQVEQLAGDTTSSASKSTQAHLEQCEACRARVAKTGAEHAVISDLRELQETRRKIMPLADALDARPPGR